jgi:hypothetical protein
MASWCGRSWRKELVRRKGKTRIRANQSKRQKVIKIVDNMGFLESHLVVLIGLYYKY